MPKLCPIGNQRLHDHLHSTSLWWSFVARGSMLAGGLLEPGTRATWRTELEAGYTLTVAATVAARSFRGSERKYSQ